MAEEDERPARTPWLSSISLDEEFAALRELVRLVLPIVGGQCMNNMADRWTLAFVGHWDYKDLSHYDGVGVGKMYSNITGLSLGVSANIGLATFCSQAHGYGRSVEMNPIFLRRSLVLLSILYCFALASALFCEPLLLLVGQPAAVARTSASFAQIQVLGVPFYWVSNACSISLNSVKLARPGFIMQSVSAVAQLLLCLLFSHPSLLNLGYRGVGLGRAVGGVVSLTVMMLCIKRQGLEAYTLRRHPDAEPVCRAGAFREYLKVSVPGALVVWSEWWAFEVLAILVGRTPDAKLNLAAHGTMFNIISVFYMCWVGTSNAVCALVGNLLGAGRNTKIRPLLRAAFALSAVSSLTVAVGYQAARGWLAAAFVEDQNVQALLRASSWGLVLSVPLYAQLMTFYGALRGANRQRPGILANIVGYWVVGIPVAGLLGCAWQWPFPLLGVWLGNVTALAIASVWVCWAVFVRIDWLTIRRTVAETSQSPLLSSEGQRQGRELVAVDAAKPGGSR